jgi:hypothetical protein
MRRWPRPLPALGVALLCACSGGSGSASVDPPRAQGGAALAGPSGLWPAGTSPLLGEPPSTWWTTDAPEELTATGLEVVARPGAQAAVVDGSGTAWLHGPWHLLKVDPATGAAESWDIGDDAVFGSIRAVRASAGSGVWLILADRIRLFDGERMVRDVPVPAEFRGGPDGGVADLVEVGSELWVAGAAGVARWSGGRWSLVRPEQLTGAQALAADTAGYVWAAGELRSGARTTAAVVRFDGSRWAEPAAEGAPPVAREIAADPTGGVVVLHGTGVHRFDGNSWHVLPRAGMQLGIGASTTTSLAVTSEGVPWLLGDEGLAWAGPDGWHTVPMAGRPGPVGLVSADDDVLLSDGWGLYRVEAGGLVEVWSEAPKGPVASDVGIGQPGSWEEPPWAPGQWLPVTAGGLAVVSSDEVWALSEGYPYPLQWSGGAWREVPTSSVEWVAPVVAADGAVWLGTSTGLVRISDSRQTRLESVPIGAEGRPGSAGTVWVLPSRWSGWWYADGYTDGPPEYLVLQQVGSRGAMASVPLPVDEWSITSVVPGARGSLWLTSCASGVSDPCPTPPELFRWDAGWVPVAYPGSSIRLVGVAPDGALWARVEQAAGQDSGQEVGAVGEAHLARYDDGQWSSVLASGVPDAMGLAPGGVACGIESESLELVCVDASAASTRWPVGVPGDLGIGGDGSVWLAGQGLVARVPIVVPG